MVLNAFLADLDLASCRWRKGHPRGRRTPAPPRSFRKARRVRPENERIQSSSRLDC